VMAAILLHDIGHGPYSHVLEHTLVEGISHEDVSLMMMEQINREMGGRLNLALSIFKNEYPKHFLHQLISSQLDMDRLDYLRRDSFFTGVTEGNIGSARIIKMLNVVDDQLVVESKGIYSIENYLTSRRLMYWQVYLHKTTVATEKMMVNLLLRAKDLMMSGKDLFAVFPVPAHRRPALRGASGGPGVLRPPRRHRHPLRHQGVGEKRRCRALAARTQCGGTPTLQGGGARHTHPPRAHRRDRGAADGEDRHQQ